MGNKPSQRCYRYLEEVILGYDTAVWQVFLQFLSQCCLPTIGHAEPKEKHKVPRRKMH